MSINKLVEILSQKRLELLNMNSYRDCKALFNNTISNSDRSSRF